MTADAPGAVRLVELSGQPLSVPRCLDAVADPRAGGIAVFVGAVREQDCGYVVQQLSYQAHPGAGTALREVAARISRSPGVLAVAVVHRLGDLRVGDLAVVAAASAGHREEAFAACRQLIDDVKAEVPIWKRQRFADGREQWVGLPPPG